MSVHAPEIEKLRCLYQYANCAPRYRGVTQSVLQRDAVAMERQRSSIPQHKWDLPTQELPPTSTTLSPPNCLIANMAESKEKKQTKKNPNRLREGRKRNAKIRFSLIKRYKKKTNH